MNRITKKLINAKFDEDKLIEFDIIEDFWDFGTKKHASLGYLLANKESKDALCCLGFCTLPLFDRTTIANISFPKFILRKTTTSKKQNHLLDLLSSKLSPEFADKLHKRYRSIGFNYTMHFLEEKSYEFLLAGVNDSHLIPKLSKKRIISYIFLHLGIKVNWRKVNE